MYLSYYRLSAKPFQIDTDPSFLWLGSDHREALANLKYGLVESNGYVVLMGPAGTGKTTLLNALLQSLDDRVLVANVNYPSLDSMDFLSLVARIYDPAAQVANKADCLIFLRSFLERAHDEGKRALLVIDEAHRLSETLLEEIRLLSNMEHNGEALINIFFVGQSELKSHLLSSHCKALRQRITLYYHLKPLTEEATLQYITHRLKVAGCETQPFTPQAVHAVHKFSRGYPRLINKICDRALLTGYVKEEPVIDVANVTECAREISLIDPLPVTIAGMPKLPDASPKWWQRMRGGPAFSRMEKQLTVAFKRLATQTASWRTTATDHMMKGYAATRTFIAEKPRQMTIASASIAALLAVAVLIVGLIQYQGDQLETQTADTPTQAPDEAYLSASYSRSAAPDVDSAAPSKSKHNPANAQASPSSKSSTGSMEENAAAMLAQGDYLAAMQLLEADGDPAVRRPAAATLFSQALAGRAGQLKNQSPQEAERLLHKAIKADPRNVDALAALGNLYTRTKTYSQAIDAYQKAIELDPRRTDVLFNLGYIFATTGMYTSSEEMLSRVVELKPDYTDKALFNLAVVQQKLGKRQESLASLEAAVAIRPDNRQAQAYLKELKAVESN